MPVDRISECMYRRVPEVVLDLGCDGSHNAHTGRQFVRHDRLARTMPIDGLSNAAHICEL